MEPVSAEALALHRRAIVCDGHCDTILVLERQGRSLGERSAQGHVDLPRLREGGVTAQVFALFVEDAYLPGEAIHRTLQLLDRFYQEMAANAGRVFLATRAADVRRAKIAGQVAAILGIEGGEALEGDLAVLRVFYRLGVRLLTLTWNRRNALADGLKETRTAGGLTNLGVEAVQEMNRLGMLVDIAHIAPAGLRDVLQVSTAPVIASHANARAVTDHHRNVGDEDVRAIAEKGGLVGVTFVPSFVDPEKPSLERLVDHVVHLLQMGGEDHVGVGSDFDGFGPAEHFQDIPDVSHLPRLTEALLRRGLSERVVEKVLGENFLRVFAEVAG
jgi:membrane dipeptidase